MSISLPSLNTSSLERRRLPWRASVPIRFVHKRSRGATFDSLLMNASAAKLQGRRWAAAYRRRVLLIDAAVIGAVLVVAQVVFAVYTSDEAQHGMGWFAMTAMSVGLTATWLLALELKQSRDISLVGIGTDEYGRVVSATFWVFGLIAVVSLLFKVHVPRSYLAIALLLGLSGLVLARHQLRRDLARRRERGEYITRVVMLGAADSVAVLCESLRRTPHAGYRVVGVCIPHFQGEIGEELVTPTGAVPVLGDDNSVESALRLMNADALAVAAAEQLGPSRMKKLVWRLEAMGTDLIVVPGVTDVAGTRFRMRPIDNLPLFHVAPPRQDGPSAVGKRLFDLAFGTAAMIAAFPILVMAALAIKLDDGGPVFFRQERVGHLGSRFRIIKLRTMICDAEAKKDAEKAAVGASGVFYKSACDSRITRVGQFLRATSIDELPQLFNVLGGSMSVVGPRPLVPGEGASVADFVERRGLVKPGITGMWQISGRSDATEEERIRLDHLYVDNWSCVLDLVIVWRTVRAVLKREGAY